MDTLDRLAAGNARFARRDFDPALRMMPSAAVLVIGCVDPRVDPSHVFGMDLGESAVLRNIGGRVTPGMLEQLALLRTLAQATTGDLRRCRPGVPRVDV